ncbi:MAG TPA: DUF2306 domain-containing protein [Pseudonocardia sp.]|jgi:uncharacterized membrane protein|uniref:DUF2306 domain-containing protein n=1 Tax=Pseudonocardia sp. TaxID=60912 RepID=UPI002B4B7ABB|nr:DUF2306 domain-containing protein [Pseudonocardia sp.]HLU60038.1 DUF2306 domain-containing protein [Pseudonocardia sp.]
MDTPLVRPRRIWLMLVVAVVAGAVMAAPYASLDPAAGRIAVEGPLHHRLLIAHIATATVALVLGPLQFVPALRARRRWHRGIGCTYLAAGVLPSAVVAVPVALLSDSLVSRVGLVVVAAGWLGTAVAALRAIRAGDVAAHRAWMTRNYALTFLAVTARIVVPLLLLVGLLSGAIAPAEMPTAVASLIPAGQIAGCAINLAVAEVVLRRARRGPTGSGPRRAAQAPAPAPR